MTIVQDLQSRNVQIVEVVLQSWIAGDREQFNIFWTSKSVFVVDFPAVIMDRDSNISQLFLR